jgi:hypothetical protein
MNGPRGIATLIGSLLLSSCGGGDGGGGTVPQPSPAPAPPARVTLGANNYKNAVTLSMGVASTAYMYARLGVSITDRWLNVPISFFPLLACPEGGSMSIELTDKNSDRSLDPGDTLHLRWERCQTQGATTTGIVRVEVNEATPLAGGREYRLTVTVSDLRIERDAVPSATVNFIAQVHYSRTATHDYIEVANAVFDSGQVIGDTGTSTLQVAFYQDNAAQTYRYSVGGTVSSGALGGELEFASPAPFTGVIGEYPSAGRMTVSGNAGSAARLSEEGSAAADVATVLVAVDTNGDGVVDASEAQLAWMSVVPVQLFAAVADQATVAVPMP